MVIGCSRRVDGRSTVPNLNLVVTDEILLVAYPNLCPVAGVKWQQGDLVPVAGESLCVFDHIVNG